MQTTLSKSLISCHTLCLRPKVSARRITVRVRAEGFDKYAENENASYDQSTGRFADTPRPKSTPLDTSSSVRGPSSYATPSYQNPGYGNDSYGLDSYTLPNGPGGGGDGGSGGSGDQGGSSSDGDSSNGRLFTLILSFVLLAGGAYGYKKSGSKQSAKAGAIVAAALLVASLLMGNPAFMKLGYRLALGTTLALTYGMAKRYEKTGKIMPSGALAGLATVYSIGYLASGNIL